MEAHNMLTNAYLLKEKRRRDRHGAPVPRRQLHFLTETSDNEATDYVATFTTPITPLLPSLPLGSPPPLQQSTSQVRTTPNASFHHPLRPPRPSTVAPEDAYSKGGCENYLTKTFGMSIPPQHHTMVDPLVTLEPFSYSRLCRGQEDYTNISQEGQWAACFLHRFRNFIWALTSRISRPGFTSAIQVMHLKGIVINSIVAASADSKFAPKPSIFDDPRKLFLNFKSINTYIVLCRQ